MCGTAAGEIVISVPTDSYMPQLGTSGPGHQFCPGQKANPYSRSDGDVGGACGVPSRTCAVLSQQSPVNISHQCKRRVIETLGELSDISSSPSGLRRVEELAIGCRGRVHVNRAKGGHRETANGGVGVMLGEKRLRLWNGLCWVQSGDDGYVQDSAGILRPGNGTHDFGTAGLYSCDKISQSIT